MIKATIKALVHVEICEINEEDKLRNPTLTDYELKELIKEAVNYGEDFTYVTVDDVKVTYENV